VMAILGETIAPMVSTFYFSNPIMLHLDAQWPLAVNILFGIAVGLIAGFFIPIVASVTSRFHSGFTLYNMGVVGGFIAMFTAALLKCFGIAVPTESIWLTGRNTEIAIFLFALFAILINIGFVFGNQKKTDHKVNFKGIINHSGLAPNDFRAMFGDTAYVNMGLLGMIGTGVVLILNADLNGATFACIFSMVAFGAFGKHVTNVLPLILGATICAFLNATPLTAPGNILPILFCTCLAPIPGEHGWLWGMATGFMHVVTTQHVGSLTNGFNLYNNGFASGFVAFLMIAIINVFKKPKPAE
ncbi:MAG: DUF1576 domain-containing protein, partial [Clostridiales bacterium]|nr:DUF1576 domain-containing protein [Clostridiales bacterium]